jgi:hypothetical protein
MAENTAPAKCTDSEWRAAREAGLLFCDPGSTAQEIALHKFAQAMRAEGYAAAIEWIATGEQQ